MSAPPTPAVVRIPSELRTLIAAAFVIAIGFGLVSPVLPQYAKSFDVGVAAASVIVSAFAFMRLVFAPGSGALVTRFGERTTYLAGLLIVAISTGAAAFANSYAQLLIFRGLGGIGSTMFTVSSMGLLVRLAPPSIRGKVSSAYGTAFLIGGMMGPTLGSLLAAWGYRAPFLIYAVALLLAVFIVATMLPAVAVQPAPGTTPLPPLTVREALGDSAYRAALLAGLGNGWANFGTRVAILPLFAAATPGIGAGMAGVALTLFAVGNFAVLNLAGRYVDRRGRRPLVLAGLAVGAVATAGQAYVGGVVPFLVLSALAGVGAGLFTPGQQAAVADVVGSTRSGGQVLAAVQMAQDAGAIFGPIIAGYAADHFGYGVAFQVAGAMLALGFLGWLPARETRTPEVGTPQSAPT